MWSAGFERNSFDKQGRSGDIVNRRPSRQPQAAPSAPPPTSEGPARLNASSPRSKLKTLRSDVAKSIFGMGAAAGAGGTMRPKAGWPRNPMSIAKSFRRWRDGTTSHHSICLRGRCAGWRLVLRSSDRNDAGVCSGHRKRTWLGLQNCRPIVFEIAGAVIRAEPGVDVGWRRDVLPAVKAATCSRILLR